MNSRDQILAQIRNNQPTPAVPLPEVQLFNDNSSEALLPLFKRQLERMGGQSFEVNSIEEIKPKILELYPEAKVICSTVSEISGTKPIEVDTDPHELADVDVGIIRAKFGVAETGAVWLTQEDLIVNALGFLSQHLVVLLDAKKLVMNLHEAYQNVNLKDSGYGVFMAGPSATGDVEAVMIKGAQGARSLSVFLL